MKSQGKALRTTAVIQYSKKAASILAAWTASMPLLFYPPNGKVQLELLIHPDAQKVTLLKSTRPVTSFVYHADGAVSIFDHHLKGHVTFPAGQVPRQHAPQVAVSRPEVRQEGELTLVKLTMPATDLGVLVQELVFRKDEALAEFGPLLLRMAHACQDCDQPSRYPVDMLGQQGCLIEERLWVGEDPNPLMEMHFENTALVDDFEREFEPPHGYQPMQKVLKETRRPAQKPETRPAPEPPPLQKFAAQDVSKSASTFKIDEKLSPDCLGGSTRFGSMSAVLHQNLLDHSKFLINTIAPMLRNVTLANGTLTFPWLASMAAVTAANDSALGSGLFCLLRDPRTPSTAPGGLSGGTGLLDRIALKNLLDTNGNQPTRTQQDFNAGRLARTLATWGVSATASANLTAASGDLSALSVDDLIDVVEGYETNELGTFTIPDLPLNLPADGCPYVWNNLLNAQLTQIGGSLDFSVLNAAVINTALIGDSGDIILDLNLPTITLTAGVCSSVTALGWGVLVGSATLGCLLIFPFGCLSVGSLAALLAFVLNNVTTLTVQCSGVSMRLIVQYQWDANTSRVDPSVTATGSTGTVSVVSSWDTPNLIGNTFNSIVTTLGNLFNAWLGFMVDGAAGGVKNALVQAGLRMPSGSGELMLEADSGFASSTPGESLVLTADIKPVANVAVQPFMTQVANSSEVRTQLERAQKTMHQGLNPQPPNVPGPGEAIKVGTYISLGISQNALNYYIFGLWKKGGVFESAIKDQPTLTELMRSVPPGVFERQPGRVAMWLAAPPRLEISMDGIARGTRPLVVFFDDVRACFQVPLGNISKDPSQNFLGVWEFSFNLRTTATLQLDWPWMFSLAIDNTERQLEPTDVRTWEFLDPNVPKIMAHHRAEDFLPMVTCLAQHFLTRLSASNIGVHPSAVDWNRPLPAMQQEIVQGFVPGPDSNLEPQTVYMEILGRHKALYLLTAVRSSLIELVDGSGAPLLNQLVDSNLQTPPVSIRSLVCRSGVSLRFLGDQIGLADFVVP